MARPPRLHRCLKCAPYRSPSSLSQPRSPRHATSAALVSAPTHSSPTFSSPIRLPRPVCPANAGSASATRRQASFTARSQQAPPHICCVQARRGLHRAGLVLPAGTPSGAGSRTARAASLAASEVKHDFPGLNSTSHMSHAYASRIPGRGRHHRHTRKPRRNRVVCLFKA